MPGARVSVAVGVVCDGKRVLAARRPPGAHQGGLWEFPGGRVEPGETPLQALRRELYEEVNLQDGEFAPLMTFDYDYPDRSLRFAVFRVTRPVGALRPREGQELSWAAPESLGQLDFPAANRGIIAACRLPPLYLVTPDPAEYGPSFSDDLAERLAAGVRLVQLRCARPDKQRRAIAAALAACRRRGARLLLNAAPAFAAAAGAAGVHLSSRRLLRLDQRPLGRDYWVAASCHDRRQLQHAVEIGADFCVLSRVRASTSHDDAANAPSRLLGWDGFAALANRTPIPVYALGGVRLAELDQACAQGAQGIAVLGDAWNRAGGAAALARALAGRAPVQESPGAAPR